jgi:hypothetical protein
MYKIIGADGKEYGPITKDQLRQWLAEGRLNLQSRVLAEGTTDWKTIGDLPEFAAGAPPAPQMAPGVLPASPAGDGQVDGPAIGLIVVAILGFLQHTASLVAHFAFADRLAQQAENMPWARGLNNSGFGIAMAVFGLVISAVILVGGIKMKKLESYGWAMTASVISVIPCVSPCCYGLVGIPIGIWALVVLSKPEVKSAFH